MVTGDPTHIQGRVKGKRIFFMLFGFVFLFAPGLCVAAEEEPHPEITLIDYDGNEISLESNIPYSPKNTCGECHEYDAITNAYHFQQESSLGSL